MTHDNILLARQPIYDKQLNVMAYELLFHPPEGSRANAWDSDQTTSSIIVNAFADIGIGSAADNKKALIRFTRRWLVSPPPLSPDAVVIQLWKAEHLDDTIVAAVKKLRAQGFSIALECAGGIASWDALLGLSDIVMVDVAAHKGEMLQKLVDYLKPFPVKILAQNVENYTLFEHCNKLGFDNFQGGFLCRPQAVKGNSVDSNKLVVMNLLAALQDPDIDIKKLESIITHDVALSVKLLRICNSACYASHATIDSIKRAIMILGLQKLKSWVNVIALSGMSDKPSELVRLTLTRAKMMEAMAERTGMSQDKSFTVGLFSTIDAFFDSDIKTLLDSLPFDDDIKRAIALHDGPLGILLQSTLAHERGEWTAVNWEALTCFKIDRKALEQAYLDGMRWASTVVESLQGANDESPSQPQAHQTSR